MRIDGTSTVPGALSARDKQRKDERGKPLFSLGGASASESAGAITPALETTDIDGMLAVQEFNYESSGDADEDAVRETDHLIDFLQHMQEDMLNTRPTDVQGLRRQRDVLHMLANQASPPVKSAAAAAMTRADIELAKRE